VFLIIPILLPIIGGYLLIPMNLENKTIRNIYSMAVVCITSVLTWIALWKVSVVGVTLYSFTRGFSIDLRADAPAKMFALMVSIMWPLVMLYAFEYMSSSRRANSFFAFYIMTYGVTRGVAFAANMTSLYMFYEMLSLVTIPLVSYYVDHESMFAGRKYAAYTIGGTSLAFFAVVMTSIYNGAGNFLYGGNLYGPYNPGLMQLVFLFGFFGFGVKAAVFPLHSWLPTASVAPTPVTALLHAVAVVNTGVFAIMRLAWYTYGPDFLKGTLCLKIAQAFAIFTLVYAACLAVKQRHFKRRLAFSTISNLSYMLFGILLMTPEGLEAGLLHMVFHGIIKITLFMCAGAFMHETMHSYVYDINGVGRKMPVTFAMYTISALSLIGIPGLCGFISKLHLVLGGLEEGSTLAVTGSAALMLSAFLCAIYTLSVTVRAFFPMEGTDKYYGADDYVAKEVSVLMLFPICAFTLVNVIFGIFPGPLTAFIEKIAWGIF
jgi:multicomponent Na+:H+ antiporter subunit D